MRPDIPPEIHAEALKAAEAAFYEFAEPGYKFQAGFAVDRPSKSNPVGDLSERARHAWIARSRARHGYQVVVRRWRQAQEADHA